MFPVLRYGLHWRMKNPLGLDVKRPVAYSTALRLLGFIKASRVLSFSRNYFIIGC